MADSQGMDAVFGALRAGAVVIIGAAFAALGRKIFNPNAGSTDRLTRLEQRVDLLEVRLNSMTSYRDRWRFLCLDARLLAEKFAMQCGVVLEPWPDDPEEPPANPPGGTP
jgi:hypothetical protein